MDSVVFNLFTDSLLEDFPNILLSFMVLGPCLPPILEDQDIRRSEPLRFGISEREPARFTLDPLASCSKLLLI